MTEGYTAYIKDIGLAIFYDPAYVTASIYAKNQNVNYSFAPPAMNHYTDRLIVRDAILDTAKHTIPSTVYDKCRDKHLTPPSTDHDCVTSNTTGHAYDTSTLVVVTVQGYVKVSSDYLMHTPHFFYYKDYIYRIICAMFRLSPLSPYRNGGENYPILYLNKTTI